MVPLISDFENQRLVKDADNHQSQSELAHKKRRAFLELQLLTQLDHSRLRSEDKKRRDMNENSSERKTGPKRLGHPRQDWPCI